MSKRFGRNQRRRAREEIARLGEAYQRESQLAAYQYEQRRKAEDEIARAKSRAARLSLIFDPTTTETSSARNHRCQWMLAMVPELPSLVSSGDDFPLSVALRKVPLELLVSSVRSDVMREAVHARIAFSGREVCYGISRLAVESLPRHDLAGLLAKEIAPPMARLLADELKARR